MSRLAFHKTLRFFVRHQWGGAAGSAATPPATVGVQVQDLAIDVTYLGAPVHAVQ